LKAWEQVLRNKGGAGRRCGMTHRQPSTGLAIPVQLLEGSYKLRRAETLKASVDKARSAF
jgi:hypothetical protein